ncbi:MAG: energy transducer TonB [Gemmatimonadales bacterium]|jgi:TonB family protein
MVTETGSVHGNDAQRKTANQQFKDSLNRWFFGSIMLATALHFGVFAFFPELTAADFGPELPPDSLIVVLPYDIPPPPEPIARPAVPVVSPVQLDDDITIQRTTPEANPLPPPPPGNVRRLDERPVWVPHTVKPEIKDRGRAVEIILRHYPKILQDAGIGGTVLVSVFIDASGRVQNAQVQASSGVAALDEAALRAVYEIEFTPAWNMDKTVAVWSSFDITFQVPQ